MITKKYWQVKQEVLQAHLMLALPQEDLWPPAFVLFSLQTIVHTTGGPPAVFLAPSLLEWNFHSFCLTAER
jgi:hypothetical protein